MPSNPDLKIETMPTADLVPYENNAKIHTPEQVEQIAASIREFGNCDPIAIWHDPDGRPVIVEGHGRLLALQSLGIETAPVIRLDHLTDEQRRAYAHVHNQTTLSSGFDPETLAAEIADLPAFDWSAYGFDAVEAPPVFDPEEIAEAETPEAPPRRVERGQIWSLGEHLLMCGDSADAGDVAELMAGGPADLLLTDPPYNVGLGMKEGHAGGHKLRPSEAAVMERRGDAPALANDYYDDPEEYRAWLSRVWAAVVPALKPGAAFYVWYASLQAPAVWASMCGAGLEPRQTMVWVKSHFAIGRQDYQWQHEPCIYGWLGGAPHYFTPARNETTVVEDLPDVNKMNVYELREALREAMARGVETTVLRARKPLASEHHPTIKPVVLFARQMANSTRAGAVVFDPFAGAGTTLLAAEQLGRRARVMELDPLFCDVILERWETFTGGAAGRVK